jgi:hypothetical protein
MSLKKGEERRGGPVFSLRKEKEFPETVHNYREENPKKNTKRISLTSFMKSLNDRRVFIKNKLSGGGSKKQRYPRTSSGSDTGQNVFYP